MCEDMLGKNLALIMDSRVRWNSVLTNIAKMKDCVKNALKSLSDVDNFLSETKLTLISDIVNALEPVAVCVNALGRKDCSLATAETVLEFLNKEATLPKMKNRTEERRNASLCGLFYVSSSSSNCILTRRNKRDIKATAKDLFLFQEKTKDSDDSDSENSDPDISKSIADQVDTLIRRRMYSKCDLMDSCHGKDIMKIIKNEMAVFEAVGQRPKTLQKLYDALITVLPTSCETERSFSAAGLFVGSLATDGAPAMVGRYRGFATLLEETVSDVRAVHCVLHRHHLVAKILSGELHAALKVCIKAVNKIKGQPTNSRLFAILCEKNEETFNQLLFHTEVRWLSRGDRLQRLVDLYHSTVEFLADVDQTLYEELKKCKNHLFYLASARLTFVQ
ncbi:SCAN domain-containing protein 3 [Trichinella nelsoni]|uniref:SCAN domain-containing protein 3 n=1 Tax=Trichinella nelsoni TaxID=6336 RepID=A0A0V0RF89_9BILA|nr:SCAN domain-containing protein 3 [Trichinella nelsoni]